MNDNPLTESTDGIGTMPHLLRLPAVLHVTGLGRSTLYRKMQEYGLEPRVN